MPFTVERTVGRLVEGSIGSTMTLEETQLFRTRMWAIIGGVTGKVVLIGDLTKSDKLEHDVEQRMIEMFRHDNPKVERSALVWGSNKSGFAQQCQQMIAASIHAAHGRVVDRRGFSDKHEAQRWLAEVLSPAEQARVAEIIAAL